jgi:RND family efflux transporter MFP subunit
MRQIFADRLPLWRLVPRVTKSGLQGTFRAHRWKCLFVLLATGAAATCWSDGGQPNGETKAKLRQPITIGPCTIKPMKEALLAFDRPGILGKVDVQEGDTVEAGQFLANLKDDVARATVAVSQLQAESEVEIVYAELAAAVAQTEHEQMLDANRRKPGVIPELEVRRARLNHDKTVAEVDKARQNRDVLKAKRDEAAAQLDTYRLEAPFEGFVTRVHLVSGASVKQGDQVIELVGTRTMRVEARILAKDAASIRPGCKVEVQLDKPAEVGDIAAARKFAGRIVFVDVAKAEALGSKVRVWAEVENPDKLLRAGLTANMTVEPAPTGD